MKPFKDGFRKGHGVLITATERDVTMYSIYFTYGGSREFLANGEIIVHELEIGDPAKLHGMGNKPSNSIWMVPGTVDPTED